MAEDYAGVASQEDQLCGQAIEHSGTQLDTVGLDPQPWAALAREFMEDGRHTDSGPGFTTTRTEDAQVRGHKRSN